MTVGDGEGVDVSSIVGLIGSVMGISVGVGASVKVGISVGFGISVGIGSGVGDGLFFAITL